MEPGHHRTGRHRARGLGDIEIDLVELLGDIGGLAADAGRGVAVFIDEMQDLGPDDVSALCAAAHEISQSGLPLIVVGAGLPHLPSVLAASKSYSERLFRYLRIDRLDRASADAALVVPAEEEGAAYEPEALDAMYAATGGYPYFVQAYGKAVWDLAPRSPVTARDVEVAAPEAEAELAVGFFGSRFERATPAEREYLRAMADVAYAAEPGRSRPRSRSAGPGRSPPPTSRPTSAAGRSRCRPLATRCSRRASSTPASAAGSPSPSPTSAATCATTPEPMGSAEAGPAWPRPSGRGPVRRPVAPPRASGSATARLGMSAG